MALDVNKTADLPCCGIYAVHIALSFWHPTSFETLFEQYRERNGKASNWRGRTTVKRLLALLDVRGIAYNSSLKNNHRISLKRWLRFSNPDAIYMVCTGGHWQVVVGSRCIDQYEDCDIANFWGNRKMVQQTLEILPEFSQLTLETEI